MISKTVTSILSFDSARQLLLPFDMPCRIEFSKFFFEISTRFCLTIKTNTAHIFNFILDLLAWTSFSVISRVDTTKNTVIKIVVCVLTLARGERSKKCSLLVSWGFAKNFTNTWLSSKLFWFLLKSQSKTNSIRIIVHITTIIPMKRISRTFYIEYEILRDSCYDLDFNFARRVTK